MSGYYDELDRHDWEEGYDAYLESRAARRVENWPAPEGTMCCTLECGKPATKEWEWEFIDQRDRSKTYRAYTQGCDAHGPETM